MKWLPPLTILLLAFALRLYLVAESNIWYDEGLAVWAARQSVGDIAAWTSADVHPPLYFWLLHFWLGLVGDNEFAVRSLSVAIGVATVAATYALARTLFKNTPSLKSSWMAWGAMALLALSRFHVWWSQEARMYALGSLLVVLSLYYTVKLRERVTPSRVIGYLLTTIAALYTLYLLAFLLVIEGLYWLATLPRSRTALRSVGVWAALQLTTLVAFTSWLFYALPRMQHWSVQVAFDGGQFAWLYATLLSLGISTHIESVAGWVLLLMSGIGIGVVMAWWRVPSYRHGLLLLLLATLIPPLIVWGATTFPRAFGYSPKPEARYFIPYVPAFAILGSVALSTIAEAVGARVHRWRPSWRPQSAMVTTAFLLGAGIFALSGWSLNRYYDERVLTDEYRSIVATMHAYWREGDGVLLHSDQPWPVFVYHWRDAWQGVTYTQKVQPNGTLADVYPLWEQHDALWVVVNEDAERIDPQGQVVAWLEGKAVETEEWRFGSKRLLLFARTSERAVDAHYISPMAFIRWEQPLQRARAGTMAHFFYSDIFVEVPGTVTLSLGAPTAPIVSRTIEIDEAELQRLQFDLLIPPDTPPATYPLMIQAGGTLEIMGSFTVLPNLMIEKAELTTLPPTATPFEATVGDPPLITLRGYQGGTVVSHAGESLPITLYWQATRPIPFLYKVFVHLSAADEQIWAQSDSEPENGIRPTTAWRTGEIIADSHTIPLASDLPRGRYTVWVGIYDPTSGERLPVRATANGDASTANRIRLFDITVP